jgi:hypothetical protein
MKRAPSLAQPASQAMTARAPRAARKRTEHPGAGTASAAAPASGSPMEQEQAIRQAAYALYEARGHLEGNALDDWLQAEAMVCRAHSVQ